MLLGTAHFLTAEPFKEGTFTLSIQRGKLQQTILYTKKGDHLRIEYPGKHIPAKPYNIVHCKTGNAQIVRPLNSSWTPISADALKLRKPSAHPQPPAPPKMGGIGARPTPPGVAGRPPEAVKEQEAAKPKQAAPPAPGSTPDAPPKLPEQGSITPPVIPPPVIPPPALPDGSPLPKGIGPQPAGSKTPTTPAAPQTPQTPGMPNIPSGVPGGGLPGNMPMIPGLTKEAKLIKGKESKMIHGYKCHRYLLETPRDGVITLWLSNAEDLPPFYLPIHSTPRSQGRVEWVRQWPALLREKKLFPMLAILRNAPATPATPTKANKKNSKTAQKNTPQGREIARWEITKISPKPVTDPSKNLFKAPKNYYQIAPHR